MGYDLGDEFTIHSYRIPWLIWIQLLVLFLLIVLFYCFGACTSDLSDTPAATSSASASASASASSSTSGKSSDSHLDKPVLKHKSSKITHGAVTSLLHDQARETRSIKGVVATSTGRTIVGEDNTEREGSPSKDGNYMDLHPCNYFRRAKLAFLKCLGLDPMTESSSRSEHKKER